jgi:hypothetical protein
MYLEKQYFLTNTKSAYEIRIIMKLILSNKVLANL